MQDNTGFEFKTYSLNDEPEKHLEPSNGGQTVFYHPKEAPVAAATRLKVHPRTLKVYNLLIEGETQESTSKKTGMSKQLVSYHKKRLLKMGVIRPIADRKGKVSTPTIYEKTEKAAIIEEYQARLHQVKLYGGTVSVDPHSNPELDTLTWRAHTDRPVVFPIESIRGSMANLELEGESIPLFTDPYLQRNGVAFYKARLPWNEYTVAVEIHISKNTANLRVWSPEAWIASNSDPNKAREALVTNAQAIAHFISKHTGIRLGKPDREAFSNANIHFATINPELTKGIDTGPVAWLDYSTGIAELETDSPAMASIISKAVDYDNLTNTLGTITYGHLTATDTNAPTGHHGLWRLFPLH